MLYNKGLYEQAITCFICSNNKEWETKAKAFAFANEGNERWITSRPDIVTKESIANNKGAKLLSKAAILFLSLGMRMEAGQCYFTIEQYENAARCFNPFLWRYKLKDSTNNPFNIYMVPQTEEIKLLIKPPKISSIAKIKKDMN